MAYSSEIYQSVSKILDERKRNAEHMAQLHKDEIYSLVPELKQIDFKISRNYAKIAFSAENPSCKNSLLEEIEKLSAEKNEIICNCGHEKEYLEPNYICKKCNDTGRTSGGHLCDCYKQLCVDEALKKLFSMSEADKCNFNNFSLDYYPDNGAEDGTNPKKKMTNIFKYCKKYSDDFSLSSDSLILLGKTGLGKTHLSLSIANECVKKGFGVIYRPIQKLISETENEHFKYNISTSLEDFCNCDLLIIDDLGAEFSTQFSVTTIGNIINERIVKSLPTIISSNLTSEELIKKYTERTASRILGKYRILYCIGEDIRFKK